MEVTWVSAKNITGTHVILNLRQIKSTKEIFPWLPGLRGFARISPVQSSAMTAVENPFLLEASTQPVLVFKQTLLRHIHMVYKSRYTLETIIYSTSHHKR